MKRSNQYENLILGIIELYVLAREVTFQDKKISRGRSHSISSKTEDLLAKFLIDTVKCDQIFVDQPLSINGLKSIKYPDLVIVNNGVVIATCDLKMDLGWNRDGLYEMCKNSYDYINNIKGKGCEIKTGPEKQTYKLTISDDCFHNIIIITDQNNKKDRLSKQIQQAIKFIPDVEVFILTSGKHLNTYNIETKELIKLVTINNEEFDKLINKIDQS